MPGSRETERSTMESGGHHDPNSRTRQEDERKDFFAATYERHRRQIEYAAFAGTFPLRSNGRRIKTPLCARRALNAGAECWRARRTSSSSSGRKITGQPRPQIHVAFRYDYKLIEDFTTRGGAIGGAGIRPTRARQALWISGARVAMRAGTSATTSGSAAVGSGAAPDARAGGAPRRALLSIHRAATAG